MATVLFPDLAYPPHFSGRERQCHCFTYLCCLS